MLVKVVFCKNNNRSSKVKLSIGELLAAKPWNGCDGIYLAKKGGREIYIHKKNNGRFTSESIGGVWAVYELAKIQMEREKKE